MRLIGSTRSTRSTRLKSTPKVSAYSAPLRLSALASLGSVASLWVAPTLKGRLRVKNSHFPPHTDEKLWYTIQTT